ncbi:VOC family protein [Paenibacillus thermotolerans]|uniref:VOC family protein n=1 Tax=Paenibacillus thermotolerans TaxID=3027807 RepID=UPI002367EE4D|nr:MULTISPECIES: VOC family protein [unclassified Paenibacillus]
MNNQTNGSTRIAPWLTVSDAERAILFYKAAFGVTVLYSLEESGKTIIAELDAGEASFWIQEDPSVSLDASGQGAVRFIWTVPDPDLAFDRALAAGASPIVPVHEAHGWRIGRLVDPFGYHWEIGKRLS